MGTESLQSCPSSPTRVTPSPKNYSCLAAQLAPGPWAPALTSRLASQAFYWPVGYKHGHLPGSWGCDHHGRPGVVPSSLTCLLSPPSATCFIRLTPCPDLPHLLLRDLGIQQSLPSFALSPSMTELPTATSPPRPPFLSSSSLGNREARLSRRGGESCCCREDRKVGSQRVESLFQRLGPESLGV